MTLHIVPTSIMAKVHKRAYIFLILHVFLSCLYILKMTFMFLLVLLVAVGFFHNHENVHSIASLMFYTNEQFLSLYLNGVPYIAQLLGTCTRLEML